MKGYKAFWKNEVGELCTGGLGGSKETIWKIGETKRHEGAVDLCAAGFHFFTEKNFCFSFDFYKSLGRDTVICAVEASGDIKQDTEKCVASIITILAECTCELLKQIDNHRNSGNMNSGYRNSGDRNSGNMNSGDMNSGYMNSGNMNSGDRNSGHMNSGYRNSGYMNSGNMNSGYMNSGDMNSGYMNSGDMNSGIFNTDEPCMRSFNKPTKIKMSDFINSDKWINFDIDPIGKPYKDVWAEWWQKNNTPKMIERIQALPNFDAVIFEEITGINLEVK